jgi:hypothetical protein
VNNTLHLIRIETRRNPAIWLVPVIVAVSWWMLGFQSWADFLWRSTNELLQTSTVQFAAPALAGAAAWVASRDRRHGMHDLLATTAASPTRRYLAIWFATSAWGLIAYAIFAIYMLGITARAAVVGGPDPKSIAIVVLAILAHALWGLHAGLVIPSRFTAPIVAIAALGIQQFLASQQVAFSGGFASTWINELAAHNGRNWWTAVFYGTLIVAGLSAILTLEQRNRRAVMSLAAAATGVVFSIVMVWGTYPQLFSEGSEMRNNFGQVMSLPAFDAVAETCKGSSVQVCAPKEYEPILDQAVAGATNISAPLAGLAGVPQTLHAFDLGLSTGPGRKFSLILTPWADILVADEASMIDNHPSNEAQLAIRDWLLLRAGHESGCQWIRDNDSQDPFNTGFPTQETCEASRRFLNLPEHEQRTWLEANYTALRTGKLTLDDLP